MDVLQDLARRHRLASHWKTHPKAIGARFDGRLAGSFGDLAVFGFYPNNRSQLPRGRRSRQRSSARRAPSPAQNQGRDAGPDFGHRTGSTMSSPAITTDFPSWPARSVAFSCGGSTRFLALRRQAAERYDAFLSGIPGVERPSLSLPQREVSWFCLCSPPF